jgi:hypothetical protein
MHTIKIKNSTYTLPSHWREITPRQWLKISPLFFSEIEKNELSVQILTKLLPLRSLKLLDAEQIYYLTKLIDFASAELELTNNPFPEFKGLHGCQNSIENVTFYEYIECDMMFRRFIADPQDTTSLNSFIAYLYREPKPYFHRKKGDEDIRIALNVHYQNSILKRVSKLPVEFKLTTILFWASCKIEMTKLYKYIFPKPEESEIEPKPTPINWTDVLFNIAETKIFGDAKNLAENAYIHNIFAYLNKKAKDELLKSPRDATTPRNQ